MASLRVQHHAQGLNLLNVEEFGSTGTRLGPQAPDLLGHGGIPRLSDSTRKGIAEDCHADARVVPLSIRVGDDNLPLRQVGRDGTWWSFIKGVQPPMQSLQELGFNDPRPVSC